MSRFDEQVAIVTGAATGIGYGIARRLASEGARLVMVDIDGELGEQSASEISARGCETRLVVGDVSEQSTAEAAVQAAIDAWGRIDILVNNAGITGMDGNIWETSLEEMDRVYRINLRARLRLLPRRHPAHARPRLRAHREHRIHRRQGRQPANGSIFGDQGRRHRTSPSQWARELAKTGIRVNCVTPAVVHTRILDELTPEQVQYMVDRIPIGRTGEIAEIAALVAWLASEECSFSTGGVFDISGGRATY